MAKPLLNIHCITEDCCDYPVAVKIAMDDGQILTYVLENKTDYQFQKVMNCLARMKTGYQYQERQYRRKRCREHKCEL